MAHRFPALIAAPAPAPGRLWLTGARLFDGTGAPLRENTAILVEDGVIRRVADGARPVDVGQRVLMPGLTDAHTHASGHVPRTARGAEAPLPDVAAHFLQAELRDYLRYGVTTIRVCGSQDDMPQLARQAMRYGAFRGPRLLTCGKIVSATAPGGRFYGTMYREADGPDDTRRAVREQIRAGADFVKMMTTGARSNELEDPEPLQLTEPELAAVTDEAHRLGYRVAAHAEGLDGCATLSGYYWMAGFGEVIDPAAAQAEPEMPPVLTELAERNLREGAASMRAARDAGVKIALGSDMSLATGLEIQRMVQHGLTPAQALVAATSAAAQALDLAEHIGTVAEGKLADLIILDGDPLTEPGLLADPARIWLVLQQGVPVAGQALSKPAP